MGRSIDLTGCIYGDLTVIELADDYISPKGVHLRCWKCLCKCGKEIVAIGNSLRSGRKTSCGCKTQELLSKPKPQRVKNITGEQFGRLTALYREGDFWVCRCECGKLAKATLSHLKSGHTKSCGCLRKETTSAVKAKDLTGEQFGELIVVKREGSKRTSGGTSIPLWKCMCSCGNHIVTTSQNLYSGDTKSCGCIGSSYGEKRVENILREANIEFEREYSFENLLGPGKAKLRFDFALFDNNNLVGLIEYQGEQHFEEYSRKTSFGYLQRTTTDEMKKKYVEENNIPLYEITFKDDIDDSVEKVICQLRAKRNDVAKV